MKHRSPYRIPITDLTPGQIIRKYAQGRPLVITGTTWAPWGSRRLLAVSFSDGSTIRMITPRTALTTWLTDEEADLPGFDPSTGRCATCDSRGCPQAHCERPWVVDVAAL